MTTSAATAPFGTQFATWMTITSFAAGNYGEPRLQPVEHLRLHPGAHVLHYASACFEGLKAHRWTDGSVHLFRPDRHVERMRASAGQLHLPLPPAELLDRMISDATGANLDAVPEPPGSLYLRPTLIGTEANIGAAAVPPDSGLLYVLASPVGDYFSGGLRPLRVAVETERFRTAPHFGATKTGANYVLALGTTLEAKRRHQADQVLFAANGILTETGASNVALVDDESVVTPILDGSFLAGVTRDSLLGIAADAGYQVKEAPVTVEELVEWASRGGEVVLTGTAAVVASVGTLVVDGRDVTVGDGSMGPNATELRRRLCAVQGGLEPDRHGWTRAVDPVGAPSA